MAAPPNLVAHKPHFHRNEAWKQPVRCATSIAGTLASSFENGDTAGGVTLATGDRILIKDQAAGAENGIYRVNATGAPTRDYDMDVAAEFVGAVVYVVTGTHAGTVWCCTNTTEPTIGVTAITWAESPVPENFDFASILLAESDPPAAPAANKQRLYLNSSNLNAINSAGTIRVIGGGAPTTADYLVGTAQAGLSAEIVVGTTPGGELGGTWASPTVDATHSGSAHILDHTHAATGQGSTGGGATLAPGTFTVPGGGKFSAGSSFPGSPASGDRFYRTDYGMGFRWDGTRWTSDLFFDLPIPGQLADYAATTSEAARVAAPPTADGIYIIRYLVSYYCATNDASNYWTMKLQSYDGNTSTDLATLSTAGHTAGVWTPMVTSPDAAVPDAADWLNIVLTKVASPANVKFMALISYRAILA